MKNCCIVLLIIFACTTTLAQTFEKDNFIYRINDEGTASWCGISMIGDKEKKFQWKAGTVPVVNPTGSEENVKRAYRQFKKEYKIPQSVKYHGKKYPVTKIEIDDNYFFRPLDEQKMEGVLPWLNQLSIVIPPSISEVPEQMWALHYEGLQIIFKNPQNRYVEEGHCIIDKKRNRIVGIDFYSMPLRLQICREVDLPSSAESLSPFAMRGHIIYSVNWPKTITEIEAQTFKNCVFLEDLLIPGHIKTIGASAFSGASGLGNVEIGEGVESIEDRAFYNCIMKKITMPKSCRKLGEEAFAKCFSLEKVILPENLEEISEKLFFQTFSLDSVSIPSSVHTIHPSAFQESGVFTVALPPELISISPYTFSGCKALVKLQLPSSLKTIGHHAFEACYNLSYLEVPMTCESIEDDAFCGAGIQLMKISNLKIQLSSKALNNMNSLKYIDLSENINIEETLQVLGSVLLGHPSACIHLGQLTDLYRAKVEKKWRNRLRNDNWHTRQKPILVDFVDKLTIENVAKNTSNSLRKNIQDASILCWCRSGKWQSYFNEGGFTLDGSGRPVVRLHGDPEGLGYLKEAVEHQLCGIGRYIISTRFNSFHPKVLFGAGMTKDVKIQYVPKTDL